jgi:hypothetical protein
MRNRYHAILIILASILGYLLLASFVSGGPLPNRIAEDPTIRGKGKDGECMDYAIAVSSRLAANAIALLRFRSCGPFH